MGRRKRYADVAIPDGDYGEMNPGDAELIAELDALDEAVGDGSGSVDGEESESVYWLRQGMDRDG